MAGTSLSAPHPTIANLWVRETDSVNSNLILSAYCTGTPDVTANTYAHGAIMVQTDSGTGADAVFQNTGSSAAPAWSKILTTLDSTGGGGGLSIPFTETDSITTTGSSIADITTALTTGNVFSGTVSTGVFTTGGIVYNAAMAAVTAGNGFVATTTGAYTGTGLLLLTANTATTGTIA